jgi:tetratricopeptide (TPR) repeat protein
MIATLDTLKDAQDIDYFFKVMSAANVSQQRSWSAASSVADAADAAFRRLSTGPAVRRFSRWVCTLPPIATRLAPTAERACDQAQDSAIPASTVEILRAAGKPCPSHILSRLRERLLATRGETWDEDALTYLKSADPDQAMPVLYARIEKAWKGYAPGAELLPLGNLPPLLKQILEIDAEPDLEKRASGLERIADPGAIEEPLSTWHRLGVARRLAGAYRELNEQDSVRFPTTKGRPWAIQAAELAPDDADARVTAMRFLLDEGEFAQVVALGSKATEEPRTALLVGTALARSGKTEEAARLIRPVVDRDWPTFVAAVAAWRKALQARQKQLWDSLTGGTADQSFIAHLNSLRDDRAQVEAASWVQRQLDQDRQLTALAGKWRDLEDLHPAASELAMIELDLGRAAPAGPERQSRLKAAERLFTDLRSVSGEDPHQELRLGQVYFWLGKETEGTEIFSRLEKEGDAGLLDQMGEIYRQLGRKASARRVLELAYGKADTQMRQTIAIRRALSADSLEDEVAWLRKCDISKSGARVHLDEAEGKLAIQRGAFAEAIEPLRRAAAFYANEQQNWNNASIVQMHLAAATGDAKYQMEALRLMRRAHEEAPEEAIVLGNYVDLLEDVGVISLAGSALRADLLHQMPDYDWLEYVVPQPTAAEWAEKAKSQPELRRAAELGARAVVLAPDSWHGYQAQRHFFDLTGDRTAYHRLRETAEANPSPREEHAATLKEHAAGQYTDDERKSVERLTARWAALLAEIRKAGHGPTIGFALVKSAENRLAGLHMEMPGYAIEDALRDAREAVAAFDALPTRRNLAWVLMIQSARAYGADDAEFGRWLKENPSVAATQLLALYVRKHPDQAAAVRAREDVRRGAAACADLIRHQAQNPWIAVWAWLDLAGHDLKDSAAKAIRTHPTVLESCLLTRARSAGDPDDEARAWLAATACGDSALADRIASEAAARKILPLFFDK